MLQEDCSFCRCIYALFRCRKYLRSDQARLCWVVLGYSPSYSTSEYNDVQTGRAVIDRAMQLGGNLVSFLENVAKMFENLAFTLPQFSSWYELCQKNVWTSEQDRLGHALSFIYSDVIEFCLHVYQIFTRSTKSMIAYQPLRAKLYC
jgi:hypothetical protein